MQFNSVKSGTFLAGAKSVNDNATEIYDTARRTGFQVDRVIKQANASDAVKKVAAARRNSAIVEQASDIIGDAKTEDIKTKGKKAVKDILRPAVRMEGVNRMAGSVAAGAYIMDESKKARAEFAELKALRKKQAEVRDEAAKKQAERNQAMIEYYKKKGVDIQQEIDKYNPSNTSNTSANTSSNVSNVTSLPLSGSSIMTPGWKKWGKVIRTGEGTLGDKGYTTMFGGGQFTDLSKHPDKVISKSGYNSSAAGAYQFLTPTWTGAAKALGLKDFSPESQEQAARYLTKNRGVDPDKIITDFQTFKDNLDKLAPEWASMPYQGESPDGFGKGRSYYGQGGISAEEAWKIYQSS